MKKYYVYILTNKTNDVLYIGVTNNIQRRMFEHKNKLVQGFTSKYNCDKLVYCEICNDVNDALAREKQLKGWSRSKKFELINKVNKGMREISVV